jgi:hypothetical protein
MVSVADGDTADAGDQPVARALAATAPADGSVVTVSTPLFSWPSVAGASEYRLEIGTGHLLDPAIELATTSWQMPAGQAFADGDHVRWLVEARGEIGEDTVILAVFEDTATFTVSLPPDD